MPQFIFSLTTGTDFPSFFKKGLKGSSMSHVTQCKSIFMLSHELKALNDGLDL